MHARHRPSNIPGRTRLRSAFVGLMVFLFAIPAIFSAVPTCAAEMNFLGINVTPAPGKYLVEKDVNVRSAPKTDAARVGGLDAGQVVQVIGRAPGTVWLAVIKDGAPFGFVYGNVLSPVVDGSIDQDVTGEVQVAPGHRCGFRVRYIGSSEGAEQAVLASDYDTTIVCERGDMRIRFPAQMFMTEIPFDGSNKHRVFQINVDLLDTLHDLDEVFSTIMLFDLDNGEVRFDGVTEESYAKADVPIGALPATEVPRALASAVELALTHWSPKAWDALFKRAG